MATELKAPELSRNAAAAFADKWKSYTDEKQHARGFWSDFFRALCGVDDEEIAGIEYEKRVKSTISGNQEYIDVYWKNVALIEHKSAGESLDKAELQARGYWLSLPPGYRPKTIIISDFLNFRLIDVALNRTHDFPLSKLPENIHRFEAIISGNRTRISEEEITVDQEAAKLMANLYLELEDHGFEGHETSIFLIRILFLLFGDDTGMWEKNLFLKLVMGTKEDGTDVGSKLDELFDVLNSPAEKRPKDLNAGLKNFPYVNGGIFAEKISVIDFTKKMRVALVDVANYNWTTINPTIFGALFQMIKSKEARAELGEHYTSEENINKIVYPLFLDELQQRLADSWDSKKELKKLRLDLAKIKVLDPACGGGNFLVVSYKHLRQLELELTVRLQHLEGKESDIGLDGAFAISINLNQFYGIEIEEWPSQIARVALFLTDHQENRKLERITGETPSRFPIHDSAHILNANSLTSDWSQVLEVDEFTYILGNPPFIGARLQTESQKTETLDIWKNIDKAGNLDYVANWFLKAARAISGKNAKAAFVATNSISQGEQPPIMWPAIFDCGVHINFAHRTFSWSNDSAGQAIVHVVIVGISSGASSGSYPLWAYESVKSEPIETTATNINPYLVDAPNVLISSRRTPLSPKTQPLLYGSQPNDGGAISDISAEETANIRKVDTIAAKYLKRVVGARELLHDEERWCLWLTDASPADIHKSKVLTQRVGEVKKTREASERKATQELAGTPHLFGFISHTKGSYLAVPLHSSEERKYVPIAFFDENTICTNAVSIVPEATLSTFGLMCSSAFNIWNKGVSGRIKNDTRISGGITYNNFPFPNLSNSQISVLEKAASEVLSARDMYEGSSLADLYGGVSMPKELKKAHDSLDSLVLEFLGISTSASEIQILASLFSLYLGLQDEPLL
jgi:type I restriction-modification system DNA methylase subunit